MNSIFKNRDNIKNLKTSLIGGFLCGIILTGIRYRGGWYTRFTFIDELFRCIGRFFTDLFI